MSVSMWPASDSNASEWARKATVTSTTKNDDSSPSETIR